MCTRQTAFVSLSSAPTLTNIPPLSKHRFCWFVQGVKCLEVTNIKRPPILNLVMIIMYFKLWHTLIEALNAHIIYINQSTIFYTHVEQSLTMAIHTQHARVKGNDWGDRLLGKAALTSGFFSEDLKCWEAWDTTCGHKAKDTTSIAWRREAWKEEALDDLPWKDERGPSSVRQTLE